MKPDIEKLQTIHDLCKNSDKYFSIVDPCHCILGNAFMADKSKAKGDYYHYERSPEELGLDREDFDRLFNMFSDKTPKQECLSRLQKFINEQK